MIAKEKQLPAFIKPGLLAGVLCCLVALLGMVKAFADHDIIAGVFSLGQLILAFIIFAFANLAIRTVNTGTARWANAALVGLCAGLCLLLLVFLMQAVNLRSFLVNASAELVRILTFQQTETPIIGYVLLLAFCTAAGAFAALLRNLPEQWRASIQNGVVTLALLGIFQELILLTLGQSIGWAVTWLYADYGSGLSIIGALIAFGLAAGWRYLQQRNNWSIQTAVAKLPQRSQQNVNMLGWGLAAVALIGLPWLLGPVFSEVATTVGLFILMGLGLNIVVGFSGLLDLGYVAFYAIGAYVVGVLTNTSGQLLFAPQLNFWVALPIALVAAVAAGILLGIPVLKVHGDYLAIVTLGFGEIIRILALSDFLKPYIGGAQGIVAIPPINVFGVAFDSAQKLYYPVLLCALLAAFVAWRLRSSRVGRTWMAMREDEDVAEAMGISLIRTKLLAFATGAFFSGLSGAIFATKLQTIYPSSFALIISINVLALIIIGGLGSIPGVMVGALVLVGLPELLREFSEYRLLLYGVALVLMMLYRPEGLWPASVQQRELKRSAT